MHSTTRSSFKYHYFYRIDNEVTKEFYYGIHSTNNMNDNYMGSGSRLRRIYKLYGKQNFTKSILKYFNSRDELLKYEHDFVNESVLSDPLCLNMITGGIGSYNGYTTKGLVTVKDINGNTMDVSMKDPRYLSGELKSVTSGLVVVRDKYGQCFQVSNTDPRYLSGELTIVSKGNKGFKGWTYVYKNGEYKAIKKCELDSYLNDGWEIRGHTKGRKSPTAGMVWVKRGNEHKIINIELKQQYIDDGWECGRNVNPIGGMIGVQKDGVNKYIKPEEFDSYIQNGWVVGMSSRNKGMVTISDDGGNTWKQVSKEEYHINKDRYICKASIQSNCKGLKYIHNGTELKRVKQEDIQNFIDLGWKLGKKD